MPVFEYRGVKTSGKKTKGSLNADSSRALKIALKKKGIFVTEFYEAKEADAKRKERGEIKIKVPGFGGVRPQDISIMTRQLATLQRAGIPLIDSLSALVEQTENETLRRVIEDVRQKVNEGIALYVAMSEHDVFVPLYINMIRAGESSGSLDIVLLRLADFLDDQAELRSKISGAMVYPIIMTVIGGLVVAFLMAFVVPQITQIYADQAAALPLPTTFLIFISSMITKFWWLMIILTTAAIHYFRKWKKTKKGKQKWDTWTLKIPIIGDLQRLIAVARFSRTLGTLLNSGVALLNALDIVKNILGNTVLIAVVEQARLNIREGESIAEPLKKSGEFPPMVTHMIAVGERTGALEEMLDNIADAYQRQISTRVGALTVLLEPIMIVGMGGAVGFIVFAIMLPILQLNQTMGG